MRVVFRQRFLAIVLPPPEVNTEGVDEFSLFGKKKKKNIELHGAFIEIVALVFFSPVCLQLANFCEALAARGRC